MASFTTTVLVAVDGSAEAKAAAVFAGGLASRLGGSVLLLHVSSRDPLSVPPWLREDHPTAYTHDAVRDMLGEYARLVREAGCQELIVRVSVGDPGHVIARVATESEADIVVLGRRGLGETGGIVLGSVSHEVEHLVGGPVITVTTHTEEGGVSTILLAVDDSGRATRASVVAGELAAAYDAELTVMSVVAAPVPLTGPDDLDRIEHLYVSQRDANEQAALQVVKNAERVAREAGADKIFTRLEHGHPARAISQVANEIDADAICLGRRGLGALGGILMRSTSHRVEKHSEGTVITVS